MDKMTDKEVYELLSRLDIGYVRHDHIPVFTIEQANQLNLKILATRCKNLFLRNKKGNQHYLVIMEHLQLLNLRKLSSQIGSSALSLASEERVYNLLGLTPGAVSPFGLVNDEGKKVTVIIDRKLRDSSYLSFHPNVNTATIEISFIDFEKYLDWCENKVLYVNLTD
jgi:Uncharacterized conserved protein